MSNVFLKKNAPEQMTKIKNSNNVELISQKIPICNQRFVCFSFLPKAIKKVHQTPQRLFRDFNGS